MMNIKKLYYGLISLISIVAIAISLGIIISSVVEMILISDNEYLLDHRYQIKNCDYEIQSKYCPIGKDNIACINKLQNNKNYQNDLEKCKNNAKKEILIRRFYNFKINLIGAGSTFIVFLILFLFHFPKFKKFE